MGTAVLERIEEARMPINGEVTNAELARRLDGFSRDVHNDLAEIMRRMDSYVLREVYASDQQRREDQVQTVNRELERMRGQVRWLWSAVVMPVAALVISVLMQAGG